MTPSDDLDFGQTIRGLAEGQKVFDRYELKRVLGRGGMGIVWLAWDEKLEEEIALKFMPEMVRLDDAGVQDLKRETRKSLKLTHAHIVRIRDFVEDAQSAAIAMEYIDGPTLSSMRAQHPGGVFAPDQLTAWMGQLLGALEYAHEAEGIVHRDLKPANLMINSRGQLKIADFGISSSVSDSVSRMSMKAGTSGSPPYMSPQQIMGEPPQPSDDIYSVGATIYELITGKPPFFRGSIYAQIKESVPPSLTQRRQELQGDFDEVVPEFWEVLVARCLAKDPVQRPQSARQIRDWLEGREPILRIPIETDGVREAESEDTHGAKDTKVIEVEDFKNNDPVSAAVKVSEGWTGRKVLVAALIVATIASGSLSATFWYVWHSHGEFMTEHFADSFLKYAEPYAVVDKILSSTTIFGPDGKGGEMEITPQPGDLWSLWRAQTYADREGVPNPYSVAPFPATPEQVEERRSAIQAMDDYCEKNSSIDAAVERKLLLLNFAVYFAILFPIAFLVFGWRRFVSRKKHHIQGASPENRNL